MRKLTAEDCLKVLDVLCETSERTREMCEGIDEFRGAMKARSVIIDLLEDSLVREKAEA